MDMSLPSLRRFAMFVVPHCSLMSLSSAIEPLRAANRHLGYEHYQWRFYTPDNGVVRSSAGLQIHPDASLSDPIWADAAVVCAGIEVRLEQPRQCHQWLWRHYRSGAHIIALSTAASLVAEAGLLDDKRCTLHWENISSFAERFPQAHPQESLFEIDGRVLSCAGGTASMDLMLALIRHSHGENVASAVAEQFLYDAARSHDHIQRQANATLNAKKSPRLAQAIDMMIDSLETPLAPKYIASEVGISLRQLERLFKRHKGATPQSYYLQLRLEHARRLLSQTSMSLIEITVAAGFVSQSHFTKCYRQRFGLTPLQARHRENAS